jgi:hypothetical protein
MKEKNKNSKSEVVRFLLTSTEKSLVLSCLEKYNDKNISKKKSMSEFLRDILFSNLLNIKDSDGNGSDGNCNNGNHNNIHNNYHGSIDSNNNKVNKNTIGNGDINNVNNNDINISINGVVKLERIANRSILLIYKMLEKIVGEKEASNILNDIKKEEERKEKSKK